MQNKKAAIALLLTMTLSVTGCTPLFTQPYLHPEETKRILQEENERNATSETSATVATTATYKSRYAELDRICAIEEAELPTSTPIIKQIVTTDDLSDESASVFCLLHTELEKAESYTDIDTSISLNEANEVVGYEITNPETFWIDKSAGMSIGYSTGLPRYRFTPTYTIAKDSIDEMSDDLDRVCDSILQYAYDTGNTDTPEKLAAFITLWLKNHCVYRPSDESQQALDSTAYGALVNHVAICGGYTSAFNLLMLRAGYDAYYIEGESEAGIHAWSGYTGSNGEMIQCDATQASSYGQDNTLGWSKYINFQNENGDFVVTVKRHYINQA